MNRKLSLTSLIAMVLFMTATFATKSQTSYVGADEFGFPFTFFSAANNAELVTEINFNILALIGNLGICFAIGYGVVALLSLLKVEKKAAMA
jgi:hypothetical protein